MDVPFYLRTGRVECRKCPHGRDFALKCWHTIIRIQRSTFVAQHISRKELKHDEFRDKLSQGAAAVVSHQQQLRLYGAIAAVILFGVLGYRYYMQRQSERASIELSDAMKIYDARIRAANEPAQPGELTYIDEKNK